MFFDALDFQTTHLYKIKNKKKHFTGILIHSILHRRLINAYLPTMIVYPRLIAGNTCTLHFIDTNTPIIYAVLMKDLYEEQIRTPRCSLAKLMLECCSRKDQCMFYILGETNTVILNFRQANPYEKPVAFDKM